MCVLVDKNGRWKYHRCWGTPAFDMETFYLHAARSCLSLGWHTRDYVTRLWMLTAGCKPWRVRSHMRSPGNWSMWVYIVRERERKTILEFLWKITWFRCMDYHIITRFFISLFCHVLRWFSKKSKHEYNNILWRKNILNAIKIFIKIFNPRGFSRLFLLSWIK